MKLVDQLLEGDLASDVAYWVKALRGRKFDTPEEMRALVVRRLEQSDREFGQLFGTNGPERNEQIAQAIHVRRTYGGKWTVGEYQRPVRLPWDHDLTVRRNSFYDLNVCAQAQDTASYRFGLGEIRCVRLLPAQSADSYWHDRGQADYIRNLAARIKESGWFERVIVSQHPDGSVDLVEGQHRVRAVYWHLGGKTVPCDLIRWEA